MLDFGAFFEGDYKIDSGDEFARGHGKTREKSACRRGIRKEVEKSKSDGYFHRLFDNLRNGGGVHVVFTLKVASYGRNNGNENKRRGEGNIRAFRFGIPLHR